MGTWHGDPDDAAARFLAEHGGVSSFDARSAEHVAEFGNESLLPPWPPEVNQQAGFFLSSADNESPLVVPTICAVCATPVRLHGDAGWRHELGYQENWWLLDTLA